MLRTTRGEGWKMKSEYLQETDSATVITYIEFLQIYPGSLGLCNGNKRVHCPTWCPVEIENKGGYNKNELEEYSTGYLSLNYYFKEFCLAKRKYFTANP